MKHWIIEFRFKPSSPGINKIIIFDGYFKIRTIAR